MDEICRKAVFIERQGGGGVYLNVPETLIAQLGSEFHSVFAEEKAVGLERFGPLVSAIVVVDVGLVHMAVPEDPFSIAEGNAGAFLAFYRYSYRAGHVLSEVIHPACVVYLVEVHGPVFAAGAKGVHCLCLDPPGGGFPPHCLVPEAVVESGVVPAVYLPAGVIALPGVDVVVDYGAVGEGLP